MVVKGGEVLNFLTRLRVSNFQYLEISNFLFILLRCQNCINSQNMHKVSQFSLGDIGCERLSDSKKLGSQKKKRKL